MALINLTIVTPQGKLYDDTAKSVIVRTTGGDVCILPRHIDYSASLGKGVAKVTAEDGSERRAEVEGGLLHVANDQVQIITSTFVWMDN